MITPSLAAGLAKTLLLVQLSGCPVAPPPKVTLNINAERPRYDERLSMGDLTQQFGNKTSYNNFAITDMKIGGLTDARMGQRFKIVPVVITEGDYACLGVKEVIIDIFYDAVIYIPSEFPQGGCHYNVTMEHEHGHVTTALDVIREFGPKFDAEIKRTVEGLGALGPYIEDKAVLDGEVTSINDQIGDTVQAVFGEMIEANQLRQYAIDDPKVLADTWKRCR